MKMLIDFFFFSILCSSVEPFSPAHISKNVKLELFLSSSTEETEINFKHHDNMSSKGAISMDVDELADHLGGWGRSRLVWDYYRVGIDPLIHLRENKKSSSSSSTSIFDTFIQGTDTDDDIQDLLPTSRKTQTLGKSAFDNLQDLYNDYGGKLEGGAVTLSNISKSSDGTTKLLIKLIDGQEVETVIIPFFDKGWSTICISSQVGCKQGCSFCATGKYLA